MLTHAFLKPARSAALVLCVAVAACGGGGGASRPASPSGTQTPAPTATPTPGEFAGNYAGMVTFEGGQTATVSLIVGSDVHISGTLTISASGTADTVIPLTGLVDMIGGTFSMTGGTDVVSGTLPRPGISGFLSVQIGANTNPFHGTIGRV